MRDGAVEEEVDDMQEVRGSEPCKGGEITYFSGELWWIFVRSPLSLAVNLHNFTAFAHFTAKLCTKFAVKKTNFSPLILHIFAFFSQPGYTKSSKPCSSHYKRSVNLQSYYINKGYCIDVDEISDLQSIFTENISEPAGEPHNEGISKEKKINNN